jgi:hypothetical protein
MAATEEWRRCRWCFPPLQRLTRSDGLGFGVSVGRTAADDLDVRAPAPTSFIWRWRRGPTNHTGWAPPIRARDQVVRPLGRTGDQTNTECVDTIALTVRVFVRKKIESKDFGYFAEKTE